MQLFDFGMTETGSFYYVMERLRGLDLQRLVERHGPVPLGRVVWLIRQACLSLSEAHTLGLVHRDIKPANLFACRLGQQYDFLKVLDFGVVSRGGAERAASITAAGLVVGTPAFLAPELISGSGEFDHRADIYGLGCVAFWLLTGRPPFDAGGAMSLLQHQVDTVAPVPSTLSREPIPTELDELVVDCLSMDPLLRPADVDELRKRLDAFALATPWNQGRARAWWEQHEPELVAHG